MGRINSIIAGIRASGSGAVDPSGITGYTNVTTALDATGSGTRYDIGGGNEDYDELDELDWTSLGPGDVVNIYYRGGTPYYNLILLSEQGTEANPIIINGVTDASGNRPIIDADDAVVVGPEHWDSDFFGTMVMLHRNTAGDGPGFGNVAEHITIQNLHFRNATDAYQYNAGAGLVDYDPAARAIWSHGAQYINIYGCIIENCGSGIFVQAPSERNSKTWHIAGNLFRGNGNASRDHQIYLQAVNDPGEKNIVEGNVFDDPRSGVTSVAQLKIRGTGNIIRYNWFTSAQRTIDLVEGQDVIPDWIFDNYTAQQVIDEYYTTYIYGNAFVIDYDASGTPGQLLHAGMDTLEPGDNGEFQTAGSANGEPANRGLSGGATYFYHNTLYRRSTYPPDSYRTQLFDLDSNNEDESTYLPGTLIAVNNVFEFAGSGTRVAHGDRSGDIQYVGANLTYLDPLHNDILYESDAYANAGNTGDDSGIDISTQVMITDSAALTDPGNATLFSKDLTLSSSSPAIGQAAPLPSALSAYPVTMQPVDPATGGADLRSATADLGAYESGLSQVYDNFNGSGAIDSSKWQIYNESISTSYLEITQSGGYFYADWKGDAVSQTTLWFNGDEGQLYYFEFNDDCQLVFEGIRLLSGSSASEYQFIGPCAHNAALDYMFAVAGNRGGTGNTIEYKVKHDGTSNSSQNDTGSNTWTGSVDIRVTVVSGVVTFEYWNGSSWIDIPHQNLSGGKVDMSGTFKIGLICYGFDAYADPFVGACSQVKIISGTPL